MIIVIPLAGKDKKFEALGNAKPLIKVMGKPIIQWIAESRPFSYKNAIFILLREHQFKYDINNKLIELFGKDIKIVWSEQITDGAPQSVLLAKEMIDNEDELIIDLADQYLDLCGFNDFIKAKCDETDGIIPTFESYYWNRGYMLLDKSDYVINVSEKDKEPISSHSTACISYFKKGSDFVEAAEGMISTKHVAANGAYLISLVYNELIAKGRKIITFPCDFIGTLGSIEGVNCFEQLVRPLRSKS